MDETRGRSGSEGARPAAFVPAVQVWAAHVRRHGVAPGKGDCLQVRGVPAPLSWSDVSWLWEAKPGVKPVPDFRSQHASVNHCGAVYGRSSGSRSGCARLWVVWLELNAPSTPDDSLVRSGRKPWEATTADAVPRASNGWIAHAGGKWGLAPGPTCGLDSPGKSVMGRVPVPLFPEATRT